MRGIILWLKLIVKGMVMGVGIVYIGDDGWGILIRIKFDVLIKGFVIFCFFKVVN